AEQLQALIQAFKPSVLYPIVAVAALTGARRSEILALRWTDLDPDKNTLRIERAIDETDKHERYRRPSAGGKIWRTPCCSRVARSCRDCLGTVETKGE